MAKETEEVVEEITIPEGEVPSITAGDLTTMVSLIDAATQRGAFRGPELSTVGALRDKLALIVEAITPAEEGAEEANDAA